MLKRISESVSARLFMSAAGLVFISEMGDKTQITTLLLAGENPTYVLWVALGSAMALLCTSFIEVLIGSQIIARFLGPRTINLVSGILFLILGLLLVAGIIGNIEPAHQGGL